MDLNDPTVPQANRPAKELGSMQARKMSRNTRIGLVLLAIVLVGLWLLRGLLLAQPEQTSALAAAQPANATSFKPSAEQWAGFKTAEVGLKLFALSEITDGKITTDDDLTTTVFSPYTGRVTRLFVKAGDTVKLGDPLLGMQAAEFVQAANDLVAAHATDETTKAQLALAITTEQRQHELYLSQGSALKDWQQSRVDLANARGNFSSAEVALGAVRGRLRILGKSDLAVAAMETSFQPTRFSPETVVPAPIGGTIIQRQVGLGQNIATQGNGGSTPIFVIGDTSRVWLVANAREVDAPRIHIGDAVEVSVLALPDRIFHATVTYVANGLDPVTHRLPIRAEIANPDGVLKPEMFATFRIITGQAKEAPAVPAPAVVYDPDGSHVWLVGPDKTLSIREITTGRSDGDIIEVRSGLQPGDVVVTSGSLFIDRAAEAD